MEGRGAAQGTARVERAVANRPYLSLIDGVRGLAALSVLFYHYVHFFMSGPDRLKMPGYQEVLPAREVLWPAYEWGYFAVQVFWLISGFVFAHVYYGHRVGTRSFVVNRIARLYPLHLLTLLVVTGLQFIALYRLGYTPIYGKFDWQHFVAQLFMASDWIRTGLSFNGPIWSVSVEIAVYAIFWLTRGLARRFGAVFTIAMALGFGFADYKWGASSGVLSCGSYFFAGCSLSILREGYAKNGRILALLATVFALGGVASTIGGGDAGWRIFGITGIFGALFLLLAEWQNSAPAWLDRACEWLGENTYGVYLWHFPIQLTMMLVLMPAIRTQDIARNGWFLALFFCLTVVIARLSYVWFERPMRDFLRERLAGSRHRPANPPKGGDKQVPGS